MPILGVIDQPILKERWLGCQGRASTLNGKRQALARPAAGTLLAAAPSAAWCGGPLR